MSGLKTRGMSQHEVYGGALRPDQLFQQQHRQTCRWADRMFSVLMVIQFFSLLATAAWISPLTWSGTDSAVHNHIWAALFIGGPVTLYPAFLAWQFPGWTNTRFTIAVAQMLVSALLIHFTGGRVETHFHVFGSLAFLTIYRDWRVIAVATLVTAADHLIRAVMWPGSLFGIDQPSLFRALEHAGWVVFEDVVLLMSIRQSRSETRQLCHTISEVSECSQRVQENSQRLSVTSSDLASGVARQRSDVESISSAIAQLTEMTESIRHVSVQLDHSADEARTLAQRGAIAAGRTDQEMRKIQEASREMASVVDDVEKISKQTNLLALNATIEASRAGEAGRGFAVVATQVKELANQTRQSAMRVTSLISESIKRTSDGVAASQVSRDDLNSIIQSVDITVSRIREILAATNSQSAAVTDVTRSASELTLMSHQTEATSDAVAHSSSSLRHSAEQLTRIVGSFCDIERATSLATRDVAV